MKGIGDLYRGWGLSLLSDQLEGQDKIGSWMLLSLFNLKPGTTKRAPPRVGTMSIDEGEQSVDCFARGP